MHFGRGVTIGSSSFFAAAGVGTIVVGDRVSFNTNVHVNASVGGAIRIGDDCLVGPNVVLRSADHRFDLADVPIREQGHRVADIVIEDNVWIGANVTVVGGVRIGKDAVVAAGAVVTRDVAPMVIVGGVPAKVLKARTGRGGSPVTLRCPVCRDEHVRAVAPYRHTSALFAGRSRTICDACGMVFASPMPDAAALAAYNASYSDSAHGGTPTDRVTIAFHSGINRLRVAHVERYLDDRGIAVSAVLEVGAGRGHFARHWRARHPDSRYHAIESDISCHPSLLALGVKVHKDPHDLLPKTPLDLVVMSHVLEHTTDPMYFLRQMTAGLRSGGMLFIEVPCRDWEFKTQDEPHLLFFDKAPMARLLSALGFGETLLTYHGHEIAELRSESPFMRIVNVLRARLLACGIVAPFARLEIVVEDPLQRAAVAPFLAHRERSHPARWLRAAAQKL
jgi:acetyltransferase-like isoleucine patch superfamily enzyme/SAM-dependent methyltransferase